MAEGRVEGLKDDGAEPRVGRGLHGECEMTDVSAIPEGDVQAVPPGERPRLVAIDDEIEFTKTIEQFFSARGYDIHVATTGTTGLSLVDAHNPHVVLVDLKLPGMDGDELLRHIRRTQPGIKVIVITAYNDGGKTRDRLLSLGAFAHFDKPLTSLRDLAAMIKRALALGSG